MRAHLKPWGLGALGALVALALFAVSVPAPILRSIPTEYPVATPYVNVRVLAATTAETVTVPAACDWIVFSATGPFYLRADGQAATIAAADVTDGTGSALSPAARRFIPAATFSLIAPAATTVTMECYDVP